MIRKFLGKRKAPKWLSISALALGLAFIPTIAAIAMTNTQSKPAKSSITTVYHVYVGKRLIGTVDDPKIVESIASEVLNKAKTDHPNQSFVVSPALTTVPEKIFDPSFNDKAVTSQLEKDIKVEPAAVSIVVNGKTIATLKNQSDASTVIKKFAEQFVPSDVATHIKVGSDSKNQSAASQSGKATYSILSVQQQPSNSNVSLLQKVGFENVPAESAKFLDVNQAVKRLTKGDLVKDTYNVQSGDNLGGIADQFGLSLEDLLKLNPTLTETSLLSIGQPIIVKKPQAYLDLQVKKQVTNTEKIPYSKKIEQTDKLYKGQSKILQTGQDGKQKVTYDETITNGAVTNKNVLNKDVLSDPTTEIIEKGTKVISSRGTGEFQWPTYGGVITSPFGPRWGKFHKGIDIAGVSNHTIMAADNGVVVSAGWNNGGYGNRIIINHNNGFETTYNHLSEIDVHVGQVVRKGQAIGVMGETGDATGVHLHFEVYKNGALMNPANYVHR